MNPSKLRRALTLRDLLFYGIICIQPTAPMPSFGVVAQEARGHVVTTVLLAMVAMLLTAVSYGRMARVYPSAGSAYSYIAGEFGALPGFLGGWSILLDYIINPLICTIWASSAAANLIPAIPAPIWKIFFALLFTMLNLRGIEASARTNEWLAVLMGGVVVCALVYFARYVFMQGPHGVLFFTRPFYDPATFSVASVATGTSIATLTYIGFENISTLSEEAVNPRRDIMLATVLTCLVTGIFAAIQVYAGQLVWPDYKYFPDVDTAYVYVAGRAGGALLFHVVNATLLVATIGSGMGGQMAGARVLYGMGSAGALPRMFAYVDPKRGVPSRNVVLCGAIILVGSWITTYQLGAELLNFGAFLAFIGVNLASFKRGFLRQKEKHWTHAVIPLAGAAICLYIWWSLRWQARLAGLIWMVLGLVYYAVRNRDASGPRSSSVEQTF